MKLSFEVLIMNYDDGSYGDTKYIHVHVQVYMYMHIMDITKFSTPQSLTFDTTK